MGERIKKVGELTFFAGLLSLPGGLAYADHVARNKAVAQLRNETPEEGRVDASEELQNRLLQREDTYGTMPNSPLSGQEIAGADEILWASNIAQFGPLAMFVGFALMKDRAVVSGAVYVAIQALSLAFGGNSVEGFVRDGIVKGVIPNVGV